jgi:hypothetical protein
MDPCGHIAFHQRGDAAPLHIKDLQSDTTGLTDGEFDPRLPIGWIWF